MALAIAFIVMLLLYQLISKRILYNTRPNTAFVSSYGKWEFRRCPFGLTDPLLTYPDPNLPHVLFTYASKYAWACVLMQEKTHTIDEKESKLLQAIT